MSHALDSGPPTPAGTGEDGGPVAGVALRRDGGKVELRVTGDLSGAARRHLGEALDMAHHLGAEQVVVDLGDLEQVDAVCLQVLRAAQQ